ncbi:MAG TPA: hypothetical protein VFX89_18710 [Gammaproteobacteria bacterium]|nr:hypothetical protein [Gammaproteobacteria bacterium]
MPAPDKQLQRTVQTVSRRRARVISLCVCAAAELRRLGATSIAEGLLGEFVTIRRWRLKDNRQESDLLRLVRQQIEPHYQSLSNDVRLGLLRIEGTRSYFAVQYWRSRGHWESATQSDLYASWWKQYEPMLAAWDQVMEFEDEFDSEELLK